MPERERLINYLHKKYAWKLKSYIYSDFLKNSGLEDDVIQRVFEIFLRRNEEYMDFNRLRIQFRGTIKYLLLEAIREIIKEQNADVMIIKEQNITDFYDKVQLFVKEGFLESDAKKMVREEETFIRFRLVKRVSEENVSKEQRGNPVENEMVDNLRREQFRRYQAECFEEWRKLREGGGEKRYQILIDRHFNEMTTGELSVRYGLSRAQIRGVVKTGMMFVSRCVKEKLDYVPKGLI